jgi:hypothetical protein
MPKIEVLEFRSTGIQEYKRNVGPAGIGCFFVSPPRLISPVSAFGIDVRLVPLVTD